MAMEAEDAEERHRDGDSVDGDGEYAVRARGQAAARHYRRPGSKPDQDFSLICEIYFENYHRLEFFTSPSHIYFSDSSGADEG